MQIPISEKLYLITKTSFKNKITIIKFCQEDPTKGYKINSFGFSMLSCIKMIPLKTIQFTYYVTVSTAVVMTFGHVLPLSTFVKNTV